jgi:metal-responsive CopG/Arc/MetJ family transcriptional regulator
MQSRKDISVTAPPKLKEQVHAQLEYGNDRTVLLREAFREKIERDRNTDTTDREPYESPRSLPDDSKQMSVPVTGEFDAEIEDCLIYGDSKAEWMRVAIREYLQRHPNPEVSDLDNPMEAHGD